MGTHNVYMGMGVWVYGHDNRTLEGRLSNQKASRVEGLLTNPSAFRSDARMTRGLEISKRSPITESEDGSFAVPSQTSAGLSYTVKVIGQAWTCDCLDFVNRCDAIEACKHIHAVKFWITARVELQNQPKPKVFSEDAFQCDRCASVRVIRYGTSGTKQAYWCKDCAHKFTPSLLKKARYTPEMITLTLDLYFSGLSLRKVARTLNDHFGTEMGATSIYRWIQRFVPQISEYAKTLTPKLSGIWHADELFVKMKGGHKIVMKNTGEMTIAYLWNVMDRKTRFLLASKLSPHRSVIGASIALSEALKTAHDSKPETVLTDSAKAYHEGIAIAFGADKPKHIARAGIVKPDANNNRIERLNGTLRERVKVQRGWKTMKTPIAEGQRLHYNFVKPHIALQGQTPAEVAGIGVQGDKWLELLKKTLMEQMEQ